MEYAEFAPSPLLAHLVDRLWILAGSAADLASSTQAVLPDGRPELVMHFGEPFERVSMTGAASKQAATLFAGQLSEQLTLKPMGAVAVLGVRFHPYGAGPLLAMPQGDLAGQTLDVEDVSPDLSRLLRAVRDQTDDVRAAVPLVQRVLERAIADRRLDVRLQVAARTLVGGDGATPIDVIARGVGLTRRHLERLFLDGVGIPPKRLARIARFQRALRMLDNVNGRRRGATTAAACGYADQAHFIREFRQLAGCSPSEHMLKQGELTGFFVQKTEYRPPGIAGFV